MAERAPELASNPKRDDQDQLHEHLLAATRTDGVPQRHGVAEMPDRLTAMAPIRPLGPNEQAIDMAAEQNVEIIENDGQWERAHLPNGNTKITNLESGIYTIGKPGKNGQNDTIIETRDVTGAIARINDKNEIELHEKGSPEAKILPNAKFDLHGTLTFTSDDGIKHEHRLDGYRAETNPKDGSIKINHPDLSIEIQKPISETETLATTFVDIANKNRGDFDPVNPASWKTVCEERKFAKPISVTVETVSGPKEFHNVQSIASYYSTAEDSKILGNGNKAIAQTLKFAGAGLPMSVDLPHGHGKVTFNASSLDILKPAGKKPSDMYYHSEIPFSLTKADGSTNLIPAETLSVIQDGNTPGGELLALSSRSSGGEPLAYIRSDRAENAPALDEQAAKAHQAQLTSQVRNLIRSFESGQEGTTQEGRKRIETALTDMGREALPALKDLAKFGFKNTAVKDLITRVMDKQPQQPIPEKLSKAMQDIGLNLFLASSSANIASNHHGESLSAKDREYFQNVIEQANKPFGIDTAELRQMEEHLFNARENAMPEEPVFPIEPLPGETVIFPLPLRSDHDTAARGAQRAENHLLTEPIDKISRQLDLVESALYRQERAVGIYAGMLSKGSEANQQEAIRLLTETVKSNPNIVAFRPDFMKAIVDSGAYKNADFQDALLKSGEIGKDALSAAEQIVQEREEAARPRPPAPPPNPPQDNPDRLPPAPI